MSIWLCMIPHQYPLPVLRHQPPWPTRLLQWMWHGIWYMACPLLQEGRRHKNVSQQALWWVWRPFKKCLHPDTCAWRLQNLLMLRRAWRVGKTQRVPFKVQGGDEGGSPILRPPDAGDGQYSWHAYREYWRHLLPVPKTWEVPGSLWEGEEEKLPRHLHQSASELHSIHWLSRRPYRGWGGGNTLKYFQTPHDE